VFALPGRYLDQPLWSEAFRYVPAEPGSAAPYRIETGELGMRLIHGLHGMVAALAAEGHDVIVDHVLSEPGWLPDLRGRLGNGAQLIVAGVRCPLEVVVERERERRDRTLGQAAALFDVVHRDVTYDVEVDTSILSPGEAAGIIAAFVESRS
jgi:chloramphenicol 3-O phosphotransferase